MGFGAHSVDSISVVMILARDAVMILARDAVNFNRFFVVLMLVANNVYS